MKYVAIVGSLASGLKVFGPFDSIEESVDWAEARQPLIGYVTVMEVLEPSKVQALDIGAAAQAHPEVIRDEIDNEILRSLKEANAKFKE